MLRVLLIGAIGMAAAAASAAPRAHVVIQNSGSAEYVEITVANTVNTHGWTLVSVRGEQKFALPAVQLNSGGTLRVVSGATAARPGDLVWTRRNVWNNQGDTAIVLDAAGTVIADYTYGATSSRGTSPTKTASAKGTRSRR